MKKITRPSTAVRPLLTTDLLRQVTGGDGDITTGETTEEAHKSGSLVHLNRTRSKG